MLGFFVLCNIKSVAVAVDQLLKIYITLSRQGHGYGEDDASYFHYRDNMCINRIKDDKKVQLYALCEPRHSFYIRFFFHALLQLFVIIHVLHCSLEKMCRRRATMACPLNVIIARYLFAQQGFPHAEYQ